ncbi:2-hydroxyacylsphingosine 1-beta-galactosyltransferase-like [Lineus longissimus]|uniref:2-hydroxyacylsphingosine 1-beta-galactosyltransferase-like n=1 Tax=Lineus longissimus TaxID=88925 RepID=UPI00315DC75F
MHLITLSFLGLSSFFGQASGGKILLLPSMINSHILMMTSLVEPLKARGHVVYLAMDANMKPLSDVEKSHVRIIKYKSEHPPLFETEAYQRTLFALALEWTVGNWIEAAKSGLNAFTDNCETVLQNKKFFTDVKKENFDFIVVGGPGPLRCLFIIPHRLGVPFASLSSAHLFDLRAIGIQAPFLVPGFEAHDQTTLTMAGKLKKLAVYVASHTLLELSSQTYSPDRPFSSLHEVANRASLFLYDTARVFDTPIPLSPNVIHVGGLTTRKPEPLAPGTVRTFLDGADDGFILVSFGGVVKFFPEHVVRILIDAFATIKFRVLFKISKSVIPDDVTVPGNVLTQNWIPQKGCAIRCSYRLLCRNRQERKLKMK